MSFSHGMQPSFAANRVSPSALSVSGAEEDLRIAAMTWSKGNDMLVSVGKTAVGRLYCVERPKIWVIEESICKAEDLDAGTE